MKRGDGKRRNNPHTDSPTWWHTDIETRAADISGGIALDALLLALRAASALRNALQRIRRPFR